LLDVGQGDAVVVQGREAAVLVDGATAFPGGVDLGRSTVVPALRARPGCASRAGGAPKKLTKVSDHQGSWTCQPLQPDLLPPLAEGLRFLILTSVALSVREVCWFLVPCPGFRGDEKLVSAAIIVQGNGRGAAAASAPRQQGERHRADQVQQRAVPNRAAPQRGGCESDPDRDGAEGLGEGLVESP
jgi:hypothetical protein